VNRPRAADDFDTIRARIEELRGERRPGAWDQDSGTGKPQSSRGEKDAERRRRERMEGWPPPWVPTIFAKMPGS
jgi:hypothetical protein